MKLNSRNLVIFVLALVGCGISGFLTIEYVQGAHIPCGYVGSGCTDVANDSAAWGLGLPGLRSIPTPAFGLAMYGTLVALSFFRTLSSSPVAGGRARDAQWAIAAFGVLVSAWLTWREGAIIHAWCEWCLSSAAIILIIFITATSERLAPAGRLREEVA